MFPVLHVVLYTLIPVSKDVTISDKSASHAKISRLRHFSNMAAERDFHALHPNFFMAHALFYYVAYALSFYSLYALEPDTDSWTNNVTPV